MAHPVVKEPKRDYENYSNEAGDDMGYNLYNTRSVPHPDRSHFKERKAFRTADKNSKKNQSLEIIECIRLRKRRLQYYST